MKVKYIINYYYQRYINIITSKLYKQMFYQKLKVNLISLMNYKRINQLIIMKLRYL
jgi:hypothetical protein